MSEKSEQPSYLKHKERLRQRFANGGLEGFHDYEVLELVLSYVLIRKDTKPLAKKLIAKFKNLTGVLNAPLPLLQEVEGVGERTAVYLKLFKDVATFHLRDKFLADNIFDSSRAVFDYLIMYFKGRLDEEFKVLYLNNKNVLIYEETLFWGTVNEAKIYVRRIIEHVMLYHATNIIVVHNHPSGNVKPSQDDLNITFRIRKALALIEVGLLDHIIIGDEKFFSFLKEGLL